MAAEDFERGRQPAHAEGKHPGRFLGKKDVPDALHRLLHRVGVPEDTRNDVVGQVRAHLKRKAMEADELKQRRQGVHDALRTAGFDPGEVQ